MTSTPRGAAGRSRHLSSALALRPELLRLAVLVAFVTLALQRATNLDSLLMNIALWSISALGVGLILGLAGQPALCQAAFMLTGGYVYAVVSRPSGADLPTSLAVVAAVAIGGALAALVSPVLRARGYTFALATIALDLFLRQAFRTGSWVPGRESGIVDVAPLELAGRPFLSATDYLWLAGSIAIGAALLLHLRYGRGRRKRALRVIAEDQDLLSEFGQDPARATRALFVLAGMLGALAGALTVASFGFVQPTSFGSTDSFALAVAVVIGGRERLVGALVGAAIYQLSSPLLGPELATYRPVLLGLTVIASVHLFPSGLAPRLPRRRSSPREVDPGSSEGAPFSPASITGASLRARGVTTDFGALRAIDRVDLDLASGSLTALVGPNGAGKSTLLAAIAGSGPSTGSIELDGCEISGFRPHERARRGIVRSHQHVRVADGLSALETVALGVDLSLIGAEPTQESERRVAARACLAHVGMEQAAEREIGDLSTVERRLVDVARLMAARPRLALIDEPSAGLDVDERDRVLGALEAIHATGCTIIVVEHDLAFVQAIAEQVIALVDGRVIAVGPVDEVLRLPAFEAAYLGGSHVS